jgi:O-antigen/teichoic acid export membrane protein
VPVPTAPTVLRRERAIRLTVAATVGARAVSGVSTLVQVPLAIHYLGTEAYGFWITLFSTVIVLNSVDFGLGVGMQHAMAKAYGADDWEGVKRVFWTGAAALGVLGAAVLAIGLTAAFVAPCERWLHLQDPSLRALAGSAVAVAIAAFVVSLPFNAVARLAAGIQRGWIHAGWIAVGSLLSLALVEIAALGRWRFLGFLAASLLVPFVQGVGLTVHLLRRLGWSLRPTGLCPGHEIKAMLRSSLFFSFPQFGLALVQSAPALAISFGVGSAAVTGYTLLARLLGPFQQAQVILLTPVWPAYIEAQVQGEHPWIGRTFWRTGLACAALAAGAVLCAWQSPLLLQLWIGRNAADAASGLAAATAAWCVVQMAYQPPLYFMMGTGRLHTLAWAATPGLLAGAGLLFAAARSGSVTTLLAAGAWGLAVGLLPLMKATADALRTQRAGKAR